MEKTCRWTTDVDGINWYTECGEVYFPYIRDFNQPNIYDTDLCPWCKKKRIEDESNYNENQEDYDEEEETHMIEVNSHKSYLGKEIREWCNDCLYSIEAAAEIYAKYYAEEVKFKPSDRVYYFIYNITDTQSYRLDGYKLIRDLEKSPRKLK